MALGVPVPDRQFRSAGAGRAVGQVTELPPALNAAGSCLRMQ
jgi:hypothetical protein